jgi:mRNA deadenylase 3'-5' endonuclease subunit Ccr4
MIRSILILLIHLKLSYPSGFPIKRRFIPLPGTYALQSTSSNSFPITFRVLQFNVLADGLSALRPDLGQFSRVSRDLLDWNNRKSKLLHEITQYNPDIITL